MTSATAPAESRQDIKVLGLISTGHLLSHYYYLTLPPLFVFINADLDLSFTELGVMMTLLYGVAGVVQVPVGFLVDRVGARIVLTGGLLIMSVGFGLVGLAPALGQGLMTLGLPFDPTYGIILAFLTMAAAGHSVFHPADYAILNSSINPQRMARAFSIHTFSGHLGSAIAPATILFLAGLTNWKVALMIAGALGVVTMFAMTSQWNSLHDDVLPGKKKSDGKGGETNGGNSQAGIRLLLSRPMLLFFLFFAALTMMSSGVHSFLVVGLVGLEVAPLELAGTALSAYLFASAAGILLGGEISDRTERHDLVAMVAFVITAAVMLSVVWARPGAVVLIAVMILAGLVQGIIRPARDMMVRAASPKGSTGKVFGFVSAGIAAGGAISPTVFGLFMDAGNPAWVFYLMAIFMGIALFSVAMPKPRHQ
ncbi:MAG TPA: MFS transporter [Alphaproteobacteria bacterium]|jgi:MFS family permease